MSARLENNIHKHTALSDCYLTLSLAIENLISAMGLYGEVPPDNLGQLQASSAELADTHRELALAFKNKFTERRL